MGSGTVDFADQERGIDDLERVRRSLMDVDRNLFDLNGRTALVTGGGYGLGRALVHGLAGHGARVISVARSAGGLAETFSTLGSEHRYIVGDLTDDSLYEQLSEIPEQIDILVNNAGGDPYIKPWPEQTPDDWLGTYEINVVASMRLIKLLTPGMIERGWGRVINIASIYGSLGQDPRSASSLGGAGAYTAAKHGTIGLTRYLACQLGTSGVTVNTLSPGMIAWSEPTEEGVTVRARNANQTPVGRNGQPEDFVTAVVFLSADGSGFVNGSNIVVDGGWSVW
jgi:NAD(P)-dependent dehydrogenase (short-subunit alcohol dehydrogenase family)